MELCYKLFLDTLRPVLFTQELREVVSVHLVKEVVKGVTVDEAHHQDILDVGCCDCEIEAFFEEVTDLKLCNVNSHVSKVVRGIVVNNDLLVDNPEEQLSVLRLLKIIE
jgi:hypothetical protein